MEESRCLHCRRVIKRELGHRPRQYCDKRCKQAAYRRRKSEERKDRKFEADLLQVRMIQQHWPDLSWKTARFLLGIRKFYGEGLVEDIAKVILDEIEYADTRSMIKLLEKFKQEEQS